MMYARTHRNSSPSLAAPRRRENARKGDEVVAQDGTLGRVERIIRSEQSEAEFLVVAVERRLRLRYPIVPVSLMAGVDRVRRRVHLRGRRESLSRLSEALPIVL
ncbi:MAG TPA: hypothetical protein VK926_04050 [Gaiellaceae bacterium]|nr:hypothetical protein [Gaiellaceae bacterium]